MISLESKISSSVRYEQSFYNLIWLMCLAWWVLISEKREKATCFSPSVKGTSRDGHRDYSCRNPPSSSALLQTPVTWPSRLHCELHFGATHFLRLCHLMLWSYNFTLLIQWFIVLCCFSSFVAVVMWFVRWIAVSLSLSPSNNGS